MKRRLAAVLLLLLILLIQSAACAEKPSVYERTAECNTLYWLNGTGWLVEYPWDDRDPELTRTGAEGYLRLAQNCGIQEVYVYLINSSRSINFDDMESEPLLWPLLQECYPGCTVGCLKIGSIDEYCSLFYKTDHHWNYRGSYQGYTDIIRMMFGEEEPLMQPQETVEFPFTFNGSYYKKLGRTDSDENFVVYRFEYPDMQVMINQGRVSAYGRAKQYLAGKMNDQSSYTNYYGEFYGGDNGLVQFCTNRPELENIVIFSNSYSNPVNMLIASYFNNTLVVDPRLFEEEVGNQAELIRILQAYGVTKMLLLGDAAFFRW